MRVLLGIAGLSALTAATLMSVVNAGGIYAPLAPGIIAMAIILAVGSAAVSYGYSQRHNAIAFTLGICMLISESGAGLMTARRVMENRDALRAPIAELAKKRTAAFDELAAAEAARPAPADSSRLQAAEKSQAAAETAVRDKAADKSCRGNCRLLLQSAVDAAQREVAAARAEFDGKTKFESQRLEDRRTAAKVAVASLPPARSATPLSDETGVPEWAFDIWEALALSIGLNIPGSLLIGLAVHSAPPGRRTSGEQFSPTHISPAYASTSEARSIGTVPAFMLAMVEPKDSSRVEIADLFRAYRNWCRSNSLDAMDVQAFGDAVAAAVSATEIQAIRSGNKLFLTRIRLAADPA